MSTISYIDQATGELVMEVSDDLDKKTGGGKVSKEAVNSNGDSEKGDSATSSQEDDDEQDLADETAEDDADTEHTDEEQGEDSEDEESEEDAEKVKPKKGGYQRRIDKLTKRLASVERETAHWREQALRGQGNEAEKTEKTPVKDVLSKPKAPSPVDYEDYVDYESALVEFKVEQAMNSKNQKELETKVKAELEGKQKEWLKKVESARERIDDFDEVLNPRIDVPLSTVASEFLMDSDVGPELAYALAKDLEKAKLLMSKPVHIQIKELAKMEDGIEKPVKKELAVSKAPRPLSKVQGGKSSPAKDPSKMSYKEFATWRENQLEAKRKHR